MSKQISIIFLIISCVWQSQAQELPPVRHFSKESYQGQNQNWSIDQDSLGRIFVGNYDGLLCFDGHFWKKLSLPSRQIVRSVFCASDGKVYVGGYATAGYFYLDKKGHWVFQSIFQALEGDPQVKSEEFWHIIEANGSVYFQSFSIILAFSEGKTQLIQPPSTIMFMQKMATGLLLPSINAGIFSIDKANHFEKIEESDFLAGKRIAGILPLSEDNTLICTQKEGLFIWENKRIQAATWPINVSLKNAQINRVLALKNGTIAFGTIRDGLFICAKNGKELFHFNHTTGLQNNTVLALCEDAQNGLWLGLDKGIDYVQLGSKLLLYPEKNISLGSVFCAIEYEGNLLIGSNQGLYKRPISKIADTEFELVEGSQGQVWAMEIINDHLYICTNSGLYSLKNDHFQSLYSQTGCFSFVADPEKPSILWVGSYTGLVRFNLEPKDAELSIERIPDINQPIQTLIWDRHQFLWLKHPRRGLWKVKIEGDSIVEKTIFTAKEGLYDELDLGLDLWNDTIVLRQNGRWTFFDENKKRFEPYLNIFPEKGKTLLQKIQIKDHEFHVFPNYVEHWKNQNLITTLPIALTPDVAPIYALHNQNFILGTDESYAIYKPQTEQANPNPIAPILSTVRLQTDTSFGLHPFYSLSADQNSIVFQFASADYSQNSKLSTKLEPLETEFSPATEVFEKTYTNLPEGAYTFTVLDAQTGLKTTYKFEVSPSWHDTWWAFALYVAVLLTLLFFAFKMHESQLKKQEEKLEKEQAEKLERLHATMETERMQQEITQKTQQVADTAIGLVRKNEVLMQIKSNVEDAIKLNGSEEMRGLRRLIDSHLSDEDDWLIFESNFNQLYDQFFHRLKEQFPSLTPSDLRIAAYLKMNLTTKEIAPLLNISLRGVENKRYRLRKKMNLEAEANLTEFLMDF